MSHLMAAQAHIEIVNVAILVLTATRVKHIFHAFDLVGIGMLRDFGLRPTPTTIQALNSWSIGERASVRHCIVYNAAST